jgi:protein arginine kinase
MEKNLTNLNNNISNLDKMNILNKNKSANMNNDSKQDVVLSSSINLFRNISGYKFSASNDRSEKENILFQIQNVKNEIKSLNDYSFYYLKDISRLHRQLLIERGVISSLMLQKISGKGLILKPDFVANSNKIFAIIINEDEHLKIQGMESGIKIKECFKRVLKMERALEKKLSFSFSKNLGYLTSNPSLLGTGLKAEILVHLPGMVISSRIIDFIKNLNQIGFGVSGYIVDDNEVIGNLFRISNLITLGKDENSIINELYAISQNIIEEEENAKADLKKNQEFDIEDSVFRSFGIIKYAKILSFEESIELLSMLKFGLDAKIIDEVNNFNFYEIINLISDANIELNYINNKKATEDEIDFIRACVIREKLLND